MSSNIFPFPAKADDVSELLFGPSRPALNRSRVVAYSQGDVAMADALEELAIARHRFSDAAALLSEALLKFANAIEAKIGGGAE